MCVGSHIATVVLNSDLVELTDAICFLGSVPGSFRGASLGVSLGASRGVSLGVSLGASPKASLKAAGSTPEGGRRSVTCSVT